MINLVQNDMTPAIQQTLMGADGKTPQPLGGCTVVFKFKAEDGSGALKGGTASIVDAAYGVVRYDLITGDTAIPGDYLGEWVVTFTGSKPGTWPGQKPFKIHIRPCLA